MGPLLNSGQICAYGKQNILNSEDQLSQSKPYYYLYYFLFIDFASGKAKVLYVRATTDSLSVNRDSFPQLYQIIPMFLPIPPPFSPFLVLYI